MVELVFLMFVLKLPILYLCAVVYWAVRAEPEPMEPAALVPVVEEPPPYGPFRPRRRRRRGGPHGTGRPARRARATTR